MWIFYWFFNNEEIKLGYFKSCTSVYGLSSSITAFHLFNVHYSFYMSFVVSQIYIMN